MKIWLESLEKALLKKFYEDEVQEIVKYYEEIIADRLSSGEIITDILASYDIKKIVIDMTPEVLMNRENKSYLQMSKSTKQLLILLLGSPVLLPLGIVFIAVLIFIVSMLATSVFLLISALFGMVTGFIEIIQADLTIPNIIGVIGFELMVFSMLILVSLWLYHLMAILLKKMIHWFSRIALKRGERE